MPRKSPTNFSNGGGLQKGSVLMISIILFAFGAKLDFFKYLASIEDCFVNLILKLTNLYLSHPNILLLEFPYL